MDPSGTIRRSPARSSSQQELHRLHNHPSAAVPRVLEPAYGRADHQQGIAGAGDREMSGRSAVLLAAAVLAVGALLVASRLRSDPIFLANPPITR